MSLESDISAVMELFEQVDAIEYLAANAQLGLTVILPPDVPNDVFRWLQGNKDSGILAEASERARHAWRDCLKKAM